MMIIELNIIEDSLIEKAQGMVEVTGVEEAK